MIFDQGILDQGPMGGRGPADRSQQHEIEGGWKIALVERTQTLDVDGRAWRAEALAAADQSKEMIRRLGGITRLELAHGHHESKLVSGLSCEVRQTPSWPFDD